MNQRDYISSHPCQASAAGFPSPLAGIFYPALNNRLWFSDDASTPDEADGTPLEDAVRDEREYVRARLRGELQREPTEEEVDDWLRRHTEGY